MSSSDAESLAARLQAFADDDTAPVLDNDAAYEAERLICAITRGEMSSENVAQAVYLIAAMHWARNLALPAGERETDYLIARGLFAGIAKATPDLVPDQLRPMLGLASGPGDDPHALIDDAADIFWNLRAELTVERTHGLPTRLRRLLDLRPGADPGRARPMTLLSSVHAERFALTRDAAELDAAVKWGR